MGQLRESLKVEQQALYASLTHLATTNAASCLQGLVLQQLEPISLQKLAI